MDNHINTKNKMEINVKRQRTLTYGGETEIETETVLSILKNLNLSDNIECINKLSTPTNTNFEIIFTTKSGKEKAQTELEKSKYAHNGVVLSVKKNREFKDTTML